MTVVAACCFCERQSDESKSCEQNEVQRSDWWVQGVSPDELLQRVMLAKTEIRKGLLRRYMQALDESEGLQGITTRLSQRLGVGEQYLPSTFSCTDRLDMAQALDH